MKIESTFAPAVPVCVCVGERASSLDGAVSATCDVEEYMHRIYIGEVD